jgi:hypothetical protein
MIQLGFCVMDGYFTGALGRDIESRSNRQPYEHEDKI